MESSKLIAQPVFKKKESFAFQWQKVFFVFSALVFGASLAVWGYYYYYSNALDDEIHSSKSELVSLQAGVDKNLIKNLTAVSNVLANGKSMLDEHIILSAVFDLLEKNTYPRTEYKTINVNMDTYRVDLEVLTESFHTFAQQVQELEAIEAVERVEFSGLSLDPTTNRINFRMTLIIKPEFFKVRSRG